jgi:hypothetical protein
MSATPIPRSLALALHGDLDASFLTERPRGRPRGPTAVWRARRAARRLRRLREAIGEGRQAFVVCPVREVARARRRGHRGRAARAPAARAAPGARRPAARTLGADAKEQALRAFAAGRLDVLVATTVVELGIDVPNATVMIVEDADRFGVAQLHQLRGRVGAGPVPGDLFHVRGARRAPDEARGAAGAAGGATPTGSRWPRPISRSGARATCSARARRRAPPEARPHRGGRGGCSRSRAARRRRCWRRIRRWRAADTPCWRARPSISWTLFAETQDDRVWVLAGIVGGASPAGRRRRRIAGGIGGMSVGKALRLIALSASLLAAAGGLGGVCDRGRDGSPGGRAPGALGGRALGRCVRAARRLRRLRAVLRPRAARIPAHGAVRGRHRGVLAVWSGRRAVYVRLGRPRGRGARARWRWSAWAPPQPTASCCPGSTAGSTSRCRC